MIVPMTLHILLVMTRKDSHINDFYLLLLNIPYLALLKKVRESRGPCLEILIYDSKILLLFPHDLMQPFRYPT